MDSVVHFEIPVDDDARAQSFYSDVFGWNITPFPNMNYTMAHTGETTEDGMVTEPGRINGGLYHCGEGMPDCSRGHHLTGSEDRASAAAGRAQRWHTRSGRRIARFDRHRNRRRTWRSGG